jgi:N,N'-diacetyllegionaminate synthase
MGESRKEFDFMNTLHTGVIVACRMKSSRLRQKAILPIRGIASVERCLENCLMIGGAEKVVLATSTEEEDAVLENHLLGGKVKFWKGEPDDVIRRYLGACKKFEIKVVIRVTADCPVVSPEIAAFLLQSHFETGADYTAPREYAVGTNSEIYNTEALRRVIRILGKAEHSEYMTWYLRNNPDVFNVNIVDLPPSLVRDYRLTLDYPEDLEMFEQLFQKLEYLGLAPTTANVFEILDANPEIPAFNRHLTLKYRADPALVDLLNRATKISLGRSEAGIV